MGYHDPLTQPLRDKLREAGFSVPSEPAQKHNGKRHKKHERATQPCKENKPMTDQPQAQANFETNPNPTPTNGQPQQAPSLPNVPDPILNEVGKITAALAKRIEGIEPQRTVNWANVAEYGMKAAITVAAVSAGTAAVVLIVRLGGGDTPELPAPVSAS